MLDSKRTYQSASFGLEERFDREKVWVLKWAYDERERVLALISDELA